MSKGGIASVILQYKAAGLLDEKSVHFEPTHHDRNATGRFLPFLLCAMKLWPATITGRVKVLHAHTSYGGSFWRKLLLTLPAFICRVPVIIHLHAGSFMEYYSNGSQWRRHCMQKMFRHANRVVVLSEEWQKWVLNVAPTSKVAVIQNSLAKQTGKFYEQRLQPNPTVLYLGRVSPSKGTFDLLKAFVAVKLKVPTAHLIIGGDGEISQLINDVHDLNLDDCVDYVGWANSEMKSQLMSECWVYALPSYKEGLPMGILEAMAFSRAVVSCQVGGIATAVENGITGLLVTPGDVVALTASLVSVLSARDYARELGNAGRIAFDQKFSHETNLPKILALYREAGATDLPILREQPASPQ